MSAGWTLHNPRIGAPFIGSAVDYPIGGESVHWLTLKLLGYVLRSAVLTDNVYLLASYFLVALSAFYVARYLGLSFGPAFLVGMLYTFLPYHQAKGEIDLARSAYYWAPLVMLVVLWLISYETQFDPAGGDSPRPWLRRQLAIAVVICVVQGVSDTIISGFAISLLVIIGLLLAVAKRQLRPLRLALLFAGVIAVTLAVANIPYLWTRLTVGPNLVAARRGLLDQEAYGLRLALMLLPVDGHRIGAFADLTAKANAGLSIQTEPGQALGLFGVIGLLVGAIGALGSGLAARSRRDARTAAALQTLGVVSIVGILVAAVDGLSYLVALTGFNLLRTWDRMIVLIGFLAYVGFALLVQRAVASLRAWSAPRPRAGRVLPVVVVAVLVVIGVADEASPADVPDYNAIARVYDIDATFFSQLERMVPQGSMIFQYPITPFPESLPVYNLADYGELAGYLHTRTLRWSYGGIKGRPQGDWQTSTFANLPPRTATAALAAIGFHGIWVDRDGYPDHGVTFEAALRAMLGGPALVSSDSRMAYYNLDPVARQVDALLTSAQRRAFAQGVLTAVGETFGPGFYGGETDGTVTWHWALPSAGLQLVNPGGTVDVDLTATVGQNGPGRLSVGGDGANIVIPVVAAGGPLDVRLRLPHGTTTVTFTADLHGPVVAPADPRNLWFQVTDVEVAPAAVHAALCQFEQGPTRPLDCR